ncbi:MAG: hypothetical protein CSA05_01260 [Bacteroidia bacterium]|nr:MAG: hypothetical protein CSA05_01260 [Bacteroidia bacterium]
MNLTIFGQSNELLSSANKKASPYSPDNVGGLSPHELAGQVNVITSAVPFLIIAPESRGGAMGDVGVATSPDINSMHWNVAKFAFIESDFGVGLSYTPWLRKLVDDINLSYLTAYKRIDDKQAISASLRYFSLGYITFTNQSGHELTEYNPNEFAIDVGYALKLSKFFSGGVGLRYIYSNLTGGFNAEGTSNTHAANGVAADIGVFYTNPKLKISKKKTTLNFGLSITNIGNKVSYTDEAEKNFIPTNLRLGTSMSMELDNYNSLALAVDLNKFLIPTPPKVVVENGVRKLYGKISDVSVAKGIFQSFSDAPGGMKEELHEITYSVGLEYYYAKQFAIRAGYFSEHETKGNRKYFTVGIGLKLNVFGLNFSYLMPTQQHNPLENTVRFSLLLDFEKLKKEKE